MKTLRKLCWLVILTYLCASPAVLLAQENAQDGAGVANRQGRTFGAPQVLEIPAQEMAEPVSPPFQPEATPPPSESTFGMREPDYIGVPPHIPSSLAQQNRRTYLGVLYATAEEGPVGVKVLSVVEGSPAARAGFQGADTLPSGGSTLFKAAIVVLAMSPAGPFAIPLAIAHDMYTNRHPPGDLIVAVDNQPVRDAQEFSDKLRSYQPGDTVVFSVTRGGKLLQVSVQLEEEPM
jgi:hypothetical protein